MKARLALFILLATAQLAVPAAMILGREDILATGARYLFQTRPVDPYDVFRGRYVALAFEADTAPRPEGFRPKTEERCFALLDNDAEGFAVFRGLSRERPTGGEYLEVTALPGGKDEVRLKLPFDRYYLNEDLAPEAERAYREAGRRDKAPAWVSVRIKDGRAVIEELYLEGLPAAEYLRRGKAAKDAPKGR